MKRKSFHMLLAATTAFTLGIACVAGLGQGISVSAEESAEERITSGGILYLKVNPEIAIIYDDAGIVTKVKAKNDDAQLVLEKWQTDYVDDALDTAEANNEEVTVVEILKKFETEYIGKKCYEVAALLVNEIGEAGFFIEEAEENEKQLVLELEEGSMLPDDEFLKAIIDSVRKCLSEKEWHKQLEMEGKSDYGMSDYVDTDYGPNNDGDTDYASYSDYGSNTDYGPNNDGATDYNGIVSIKDKTSTIISINMDGTTNYDDTDYGAGSDGVTDYYNTDYGIHNDGVTDYSDYGSSAPAAPAPSKPSGGNTDYDDTDYDDSDYGSSAPAAPAPSKPSGGNTDYDDTDYDDSDYGSSAPAVPAPSTPSGGNTDYDDTDYDDSDYGSSAPAVPAPSTPAPAAPTQAPSTPAPAAPTQAPSTPAPVPPTQAPVPPASGGGDSGYSDYDDSDSGYSDYDNSDYGNSDYDD